MGDAPPGDYPSEDAALAALDTACHDLTAAHASVAAVTARRDAAFVQLRDAGVPVRQLGRVARDHLMGRGWSVSDLDGLGVSLSSARRAVDRHT